MKVYRISKKKYINDLTGTGAKLYGGRWNPKGYPVLYGAENKALAALELLVHLDRLTAPNDLKLLTIEVPNSEIETFSTDKFKRMLKKSDSMLRIKQAGKAWIDAGSSLALIVPSVLISDEHNILINPMHPSFTTIKKAGIEDFHFDDRFFA